MCVYSVKLVVCKCKSFSYLAPRVHVHECMYVVQAVLAAIIWVALYGMFSQVRDIWKYFKLSIWDMVSCTSV